VEKNSKCAFGTVLRSLIAELNCQDLATVLSVFELSNLRGAKYAKYDRAHVRSSGFLHQPPRPVGATSLKT